MPSPTVRPLQVTVPGPLHVAAVDGAPSSGRAALQTLVSRLRATTSPGLLASTSTGYRRDVDPAGVDLDRPEVLGRWASEELSTGNPGTADAEPERMRRSTPSTARLSPKVFTSPCASTAQGEGCWVSGQGTTLRPSACAVLTPR
ncbi:hypothetical protein ACTHAM_001483 [Cellulomonas soli]|uniref:hypothetical protein n=1 Tax=Cellulomonas soli TaxID=931535 RepID=UPI003F83772D